MRRILFTTPTCQYCAPAKEALSVIEGIEYIDATENLELAREFGVRSVPALVISKCSGNEVLVGLEEIQEYIELTKNSSGCGCGCNH
ncbi:MAG: glutaredoxin domain-containing protein [Fusobacteriaceae bacterium]